MNDPKTTADFHHQQNSCWSLVHPSLLPPQQDNKTREIESFPSNDDYYQSDKLLVDLIIDQINH